MRRKRRRSRGAIDAYARGIQPGPPDDQGSLLQALLQDAASEDRPVFLPPGHYVVSNIVLPPAPVSSASPAPRALSLPVTVIS